MTRLPSLVLRYDDYEEPKAGEKSNLVMGLSLTDPVKKVLTFPVSSSHTVDGRNPAPPGMYKPCKSWDKLPTSTG